MFYSEKVKKAALIAYNAHKDQSDKGGYPYIMHPIHIAEQMETEDETIAALLHDVIEDTDIGFDYLKKEGFSDTVINCLKILTKDPNEDYMDYIQFQLHVAYKYLPHIIFYLSKSSSITLSISTAMILSSVFKVNPIL